MSKSLISTGIVPNDGNGDTLVDGAGKINSNFNEIYSTIGDGSNLNVGYGKTVISTNISNYVGIGTTNASQLLTVNGGIGATTLVVSGISTFSGVTTSTQSLFANRLSVSGVSTFSGVTTSTESLFANRLSVSGVSTFSGVTTSTESLFANRLSVSGVSTFSGVTTSTSTIFSNQLSVSGVSTFYSSVGFNTNVSISGIATIGLGVTSSPPNNSQMSFELLSNTRLRIKVKGTDGQFRMVDLTLS